MVSFNPHSPAVIGVEWVPIHENTLIMNSPIHALTSVLSSTVTESIDAIWFQGTKTTGGVPETYQVDVYPDGVFPGDLQAVTAYASGTGGVIGDARTWDGSTVGSSGYEAFVQPGGTDIAMPSGFIGMADAPFVFGLDGAAYLISFNFDGVDAATAGKHIAYLQTVARVQAFSSIGDPQAFTARPFLILDSNPYWGALQSFGGTALGGHEMKATWTTNPSQLRRWEPADFAGFDSSVNTSACGWFVAATGSTSIINVIYEVAMTVVHAGDDTRVATGHVTKAQQRAGEISGTPGWFPIDVSWAKVAATDYRVEFQRVSNVSGGRQLWVQALSGPQGGITDVNGWSRVEVRYDPTTFLPYRSEPVTGGGDGAWAPVVVLEAGSTASVDSQPYRALELDSIVWTSVDIRQYFTTPASLPDPDFPLLRVLLGSIAEAPSGAIVFKVFRTSDDVQMGSTITVTPEDFDAYTDDPGRRTSYALYKTVMLRFGTAPTLATSTGYYIEATSTALDADTAWRVETMRSTGFTGDTSPPGIEDVTFGGTAARVVVDGDEHTETDACICLLTLPDSVTGLGVIEGVLDGCLPFAVVSWTATTLGADFARYEIDRDDDGTWRRVASLDSEATIVFNDYEATRTAYYRIRVIRADTAVSDWSDEVFVDIEYPCCGYSFSSNQLTASDFVFADDLSEGERETELIANNEEVQYYRQDYQQVFQESEDRGVRFSRTLLIDLDATGGLSPFEGIRALSRAEVPYICVREETGDRYYAAVLGSTMRRTMPGGLYELEIEIVQTTNEPTPFTLD